ncbi:hypothetical protein GCM10007320_20800 [Pseudorhodoferax aquiterrae]|uniref:O-antigen ligase-related domain-containing protein n=2 Tax=Pseudorhodoferax aquiterrae TaxID=747304 RepID=A0ABQ3G014_9BURK|nr:hypothetical protein GCM10007320_20800 [Pseudorhodoferax aquiterrae]
MHFRSTDAQQWTGQLGALLALAALCVGTGILVTVIGDLASSKPVILAALPLLIVLGFTLAISPKALLLAIIVLRGGTNSLFEETRLGPLGGLGAFVNLSVIALTIILLMRNPKRVPSVAYWIWGPFMLIQFLAVTYAPDPVQQVRLAMAQASTFAMFIVAFQLVDDERSLVDVLRLIVLSSVPVALLTVLAIARGDAYEPGRYSGPFPHPNILAFYLVLVIAIVFYLWKRTEALAISWQTIGSVGYLIVLFGLLLATKTRSAWITATLPFLLYGLFFKRRYLVYLAFAPLLALLIPEFRDRLLDLGQGNEVVQYARLNSFAWRQLIWSDGLRWMDPGRYFMGYGAGAFNYFSPVFFSMAGGRNWGAHSVLVQLFFDIGVVGVSCYLWLFWKCWTAMRPLYRVDRLLYLIGTAALGAYLLTSMSDNMLSYLIYNWYFWLAAGAVCAYAVRAKEPLKPTHAAEPGAGFNPTAQRRKF